MPGPGTLNPDQQVPGENGGWYTLIFNSPLNKDIRPEYPAATPLSIRMPNLTSQPGPGQPGASFRDLRVGLDIVDTITSTPNSPLEKGHVTLDRVEIYEYPQIED